MGVMKISLDGNVPEYPIGTQIEDSDPVFLIRVPGAGNKFLTQHVISRITAAEIKDWTGLRPMSFPRWFKMTHSDANMALVNVIHEFIRKGHSGKAFLRQVPFTTCGQEEIVLIFGPIPVMPRTPEAQDPLQAREHMQLRTPEHPTQASQTADTPVMTRTSEATESNAPGDLVKRTIASLLRLGDPSLAAREIKSLPESPLREPPLRESPSTLRESSSLLRNSPSSQKSPKSPRLSKGTTSLVPLNRDRYGRECPLPKPFRGTHPEWSYTIRLPSRQDPYVGVIDQFFVTPQFVMDHSNKMKSIPFPQAVVLRDNPTNLAKFRLIKRHIADGCPARAFEYTWGGKPYLVLAFGRPEDNVQTDEKENEDAQENEPEDEPKDEDKQNEPQTPPLGKRQRRQTEPFQMIPPAKRQRRNGDCRNEVESKESDVDMVDSEARQEVRRNFWISASKGNIFNLDNFETQIPDQLRPQWEQYKKKAIQTMLPEFVCVNFNTLVL